MKSNAQELNPDDELMTVKEVAEYLKVTEWSVYQRVSRRQIPFLKMGRLLRFWKSSVERHVRDLESRSQPGRGAALVEAISRGAL
jgi:excisionase family DNA binding protein